MSDEDLAILRAKFEAAFTFPFSEYSWESTRGRNCWLDLEGWIDRLAGPVYSIVKDGNCAYVYSRNDEYFAGVDDPGALHARLRQWHARLMAGLDLFVPVSPAENIDLVSMQQFVSAMWEVAEMAIEVERMRWDAAQT